MTTAWCGVISSSERLKETQLQTDSSKLFLQEIRVNTNVVKLIKISLMAVQYFKGNAEAYG